jgi:hypothetical protein
MKKKTKPAPRCTPVEYAPTTDRMLAGDGVGYRKTPVVRAPGAPSTSTPIKKKLKESAPFLDLCVDLLNSVEDLKTRVTILETERVATQPTRRRT